MRFQIMFFSTVIMILIGFQNLAGQDVFETKKKIKQKITGKYLGKTPPGLIPQKFDAGQLTGDSRSFNYSFSPDGNELFFSHYKGTKEKPEPEYEIKYMKRINNIWHGPETAFFSGKYSDCDITFSPDGKKLFFASAGRSHPDSSGFDIYYLKKTESGWSLPNYLGIEVNLKGSEVYASLSNKGNLFFRSDRPGGYGNNDLYKAEYKNGKFINVKNLGPQVNTKYMETDCFIAQDESYILFNTIRPIHGKKPQIYVSFQISKDKWTKGQSLGPVINSKNGTMGSTITADGKYFFYISRVGKERAVYWVSTDIIKNLRKKIFKDNKKWPVLKGPYLGQKPPGLKSEIFAPGIISTTGVWEMCSIFSPNGEEFYYTISASSKEEKARGIYHYDLMFTKMVNGIWTKPKRLSIAGKYSVADIALSPDGNRLYFCSEMPSVWGDSAEGFDIWYVKRSKGNWSKPIHVGKKINSPEGETQPTFTTDGSMYFPSRRKGKTDNGDIYYARYLKGEFLDPVPLSDNVNSIYGEGDSFIAPDGTYILFFRWGMPKSIDGGRGLYISFRKKDGCWTKAKNTRPTTDIFGSLASLSHDGKYLFYSIGGEIYWVDAKIIKKLKPDTIK